MSLQALVLANLLLAAATPPEQAARTLIIELNDGKSSEPYERLGAKMKAAISADALLAAWKGAASDLGKLTGIEVLQAFERQGLQGYVFAVRFEHGGLQVTAAVDPKTLTIEGFFLKPLPGDAKAVQPAPPAAYVHADAFACLDATVGATPFELPGTLCVPKGAGPFPAVVLVHGSGPNDRDESIGGNKPFKDLAEGLASAGIVTLRYDKRTFVHGKDYVGKPITMNEEVIDDAVAAVELLQKRSDVDPKKVFVVGHSLGALLAPEIAATAHGVAGVVLLAPPARKPWEILPQQLEYLGTPPADLAKVKKEFAELRSGKATGTVMGAPAAYWKEWASKDGVAAARKLKVPVLVLRGARDYQVIAEDLAGFKKGLAGIPTAEVLELPGLNHLFIAGEGKPGPAEYEKPSHVAPVVLEKLTAFVTRH